MDPQQSVKINCFIYQVEGGAPTDFFKQTVWQIGISKGNFMNGGAIRERLAAKLDKTIDDVLLFAFSKSGASEYDAMMKEDWMKNPPGKKITLSEVTPQNLLYMIGQEDNVDIRKDGGLQLGSHGVDAILLLVSSARDFEPFLNEDGTDLKKELLSQADALSQQIENMRKAVKK